MEVGAADRAGRDLDDRVTSVLDFWICNAVAANVALAVLCQCFHRRPSPLPSPRRRSGRITCSYRRQKDARNARLGPRLPGRFIISRSELCLSAGNSPSSPAFPRESGWNLPGAAPNTISDRSGRASNRNRRSQPGGLGATVETVEADLSTLEDVDRLYDASKRIGRPVDALLANAGRGLAGPSLTRTSSRYGT
jgi:hypothetical protein